MTDRVYVGGPSVAESDFPYVITYGANGEPELKIPLEEARRCVLYRDPTSSESSDESYLLSEILSSEATEYAEIVCDGTVLARAACLSHGIPFFWQILPLGLRRLSWEASLLKQRWAAR